MPLNAIIGYSEMLQEEAEELEQKTFSDDLQKIHGAGQHLLGLINNILDMAKIEAGKVELLVKLVEGEPMNGFCPSATPLLASVARTCGDRAIGAILSGMGKDGVEGLDKIHKAQGHTFVQDEKTSVVFGMPGEAIAIGAVDEVVELDKITAHLIDLARQ